MEEPLARGARLARRGREGPRAALPPPAPRWAARALPRAAGRAARWGCGRRRAGWGAPGRGALGLSDCGVRAYSALFPIMPGPG